jgi:predicted ArsR family transcriptional regulator
MDKAPTTREQILDYLSSHTLASASEMAAALGVTAANIRHHLGLLEAKGLVAQAETQRLPRRGRPAKLYRLTAAAQQPFLEPLTRALLDALRRQGGTPEAVLCDALCDHQPPDAARSLRERLQHAMHRLAAMHFEPRWEAHRQGPRVVFQRCPYAPLVDDYPELCRLDAMLLERLLGVPVVRLAEGPTVPCEFQVLSSSRVSTHH